MNGVEKLLTVTSYLECDNKITSSSNLNISPKDDNQSDSFPPADTTVTSTCLRVHATGLTAVNSKELYPDFAGNGYSEGSMRLNIGHNAIDHNPHRVDSSMILIANCTGVSSDDDVRTNQT